MSRPALHWRNIFPLRSASHAWAGLPRYRQVQTCAVILALAILLMLAVKPASQGVLELSVSAPAAGELQVYFDQGQGLSEEVSTKVAMAAGRSTLAIGTPPGDTVAFRIDPPDGAAALTVEKVTLRSNAPNAQTRLDPHQLQPLLDLTLAAGGPADHVTFLVGEGARDPQMQLLLTTPLVSASRDHLLAVRIGWAMVAACLALIIALQLSTNQGHLKLSFVALALIVGLASLAIQSPSVSPDEDLHEADARYFSSHWSPPRIDSPEMQSTYAASPYGVSYSSEWNVTYLFAGKFGNLTRGLGIDERAGYRLYHATLFACVLGMILLLRLPVAASIPLIITPQVWYLFSYLNGDALPFSAAILAAALTFAPSSGFRSYVAGDARLTASAGLQIAAFVVCLALLIISKRNYWPVAAFIAIGAAIVPLNLSSRLVAALSALLFVSIVGIAGGPALTAAYGTGITLVAGLVALICAWQVVRWARMWLARGRSSRSAVRYAGIVALSIALAFPWIAQDYLKNGAGSHKQHLVDNMRELHADPAFKPSSSTPAPGLKMAEQGYTLRQLVSPPLDWHVATYKSFFGVYGYMQHYASPRFYWLMGLSAGLLTLLGVATTLALDPRGKSYVVLASATALSLIAASFLHSWTYDFQAQGRYVLGIVVLLMPFVFQLRASKRISLAADALIAATYLLSCYSFVRIAFPALVG